ncbi:hypothetical protein BLA29_015248 [Euroglyphus maynei]|uniref:Uncharacterized protein n=1 Tax=Euroglyphus maynei TaxID=6958 RepID=A0A1Y3BAD8_EURMA|nr:hypothetical protein BLA29_015248 [Euroglyphus maynei]
MIMRNVTGWPKIFLNVAMHCYIWYGKH